MNSNQTVKERFLLVLQTKGTNVNAFARLTDIPQSTISGQLQRGNIQINVIEAILRMYPDISPDWLILGEGYMYRTSQEQIKTTDQYYALVESMTELQKKHEAEMLAIITANQRSGSVTLSNIGNTTINNNNKE